MKKLIASTALIAILTAGMGIAHAQTAAPAPVPPGTMQAGPVLSPDGVSQIEQRIQKQQARIDADVKSGKISPQQANRDEKKIQRISARLSRDEAKHGGAITKAEQVKMEKELNKNRHRIHHQRVKDATMGTPAVTPAPVAQ